MTARKTTTLERAVRGCAMKEGWINVYVIVATGETVRGAVVWETREKALKAAKRFKLRKLVETVKIIVDTP